MTDETNIDDWEEDPVFRRIHSALRAEPESVWPELLVYIGGRPGEITSIELLEDLVFDHGDDFIDRIEVAALADLSIAETVLACHVGGSASTASERLARLQSTLSNPPPEG